MSDSQEPTEEDYRALKSAFAGAGVEVKIDERILALTASGDGGILIAALIGGSVGAVLNAIIQDAYNQLRTAIVGLFRQHGNAIHVVGIYDDVVGVQVLFAPDLPVSAYIKLLDHLPPKSRGRFRWDSERNDWDFEPEPPLPNQ